jgi:hypothetical protein
LALEVRFEEGRKAKERPSDAEALWRQEMEGGGERLRAKLAAVGFYPTRPQGYVDPDDGDDEERRENLADRPDDDRESFGSERPPGEVLASVCADLVIERDLSVWAEENAVTGRQRPMLQTPGRIRLKPAALPIRIRRLAQPPPAPSRRAGRRLDPDGRAGDPEWALVFPILSQNLG